jgi:hypothetical protein
MVAVLVVAGGAALAAGESAWRFSLAAGKSISSTVTVVNRCLKPHSFRVSASPTPSFVTFPDAVEVPVPPKGNHSVPVVFTAAGFDPGVHRAEIVITCLDCGEELGCTQNTQRVGAEMTIIGQPTEPQQPPASADSKQPPPSAEPKQPSASVERLESQNRKPTTESPLFDLTLELFWKLAFVETERPETLSSLLELSPDDTAAQLWRLEIDRAHAMAPVKPSGYAEKVAEMAPVIPRFVFAREFADLVPRAKSLGLLPEARVPEVPPMMFRGNKVSLLVIFRARALASGWLPSRRAVPAVFAPGARPSLRWALDPGMGNEKDDLVWYDATPRTWQEAHVTHTLCGTGSMIEAITKLTYRGGTTETKSIPLDEIKRFPPCPQGPGNAVTVQQPTRPNPDPPVIVASGYLVKANHGTTSLIARPVIVPR